MAGRAKGGGRAKKTQAIGTETVRQFNQRLHRDGRYAEYAGRCKDLQDSEGLTLVEARERLAGEYGATRVLPRGAAKGYPENDGSYLEVLDWVCQAMGRADNGESITRMDAPGSRTWALFQWAQTDGRTRKDFFTLWTAANKRQVEDEREGNAEVRKQIAELDAMLAEITAEVEA